MSDQPVVQTSGRLRALQVAVLALIAIVLGFAAHRLVVDVPHIAAGTVPDADIDRAYVAQPWLAYLHIAPGILYLVGAPLQLAYRFRSRHYPVHRRLGRVLLVCGLISGVFALIFGGRFAFGGVGEAVATVAFGAWFLACLLLAFRAIRRRDVVQHRRWMIRAFAIGVAVGTIRIWIGLFSATGLLDLRDSFAVAFWLAFLIHAAVAEWWIRATPHPPG